MKTLERSEVFRHNWDIISVITADMIENYGYTSIGDCAFYGCYNLTSIEIPDSVTSIGHYAFEFCTNLTSIIIPNSVTNIGEGAFFYCGINLPKKYDNTGRLIAYKGFNELMKCRCFQYAEGQTYETDKAVLCECGYHAYTNPLDVFNYYAGNINKNMFIHKVYLEGVVMIEV